MSATPQLSLLIEGEAGGTWGCGLTVVGGGRDLQGRFCHGCSPPTPPVLPGLACPDFAVRRGEGSGTGERASNLVKLSLQEAQVRSIEGGAGFSSDQLPYEWLLIAGGDGSHGRYPSEVRHN